MADDTSKKTDSGANVNANADADQPGPVTGAQPQVIYVQQPSNQAPAPTEGLLQPKEGEKVFYIVNGQKVDPDGNPLK